VNMEMGKDPGLLAETGPSFNHSSKHRNRALRDRCASLESRIEASVAKRPDEITTDPRMARQRLRLPDRRTGQQGDSVGSVLIDRGRRMAGDAGRLIQRYASVFALDNRIS
jgi:hypothetical protein